MNLRIGNGTEYIPYNFDMSEEDKVKAIESVTTNTSGVRRIKVKRGISVIFDDLRLSVNPNPMSIDCQLDYSIAEKLDELDGFK